MRTNWLSRRGVRRIAMGGLAVGLAALAAITIGGTLSTRRATDQVRASNRVSSAWESVFVQVSTEDEALHAYLATGAEFDRLGLRAAIGAAQERLTWIARTGGSDAAFQVAQIQHYYQQYETTLRAVVTAGQQGRQADVEANIQPAALEFAQLRRMSVASVERERRELEAYLAVVDRRNRALQSLAAGVFALDLMTFVLSSAILIAYQRRVERQAETNHHQAMHDSLTGMANRALFRDRAEQALHLAARTRQPVGIVGLDLNGFKQVNDTLGHHIGDLLLKHVSERLTDCVRETDTVARLGGDEFAILLPNVTSVGNATEVARRILDAIREPIELDGKPVSVGASIGVSVFPEHGTELDALLQKADNAMYQAKRGKLGVCVVDPPSPALAS
ncbi:GGDEF domain-containing protein [Actinoplanes subtropicus]|uniref:GGDEF domain-containing protein n=1 Tax=Actinoplanes subtropicus TaxID=543632 RepID=UPI0012F89C0E|nr:GGDEF domain-containing protein [Actinoplanes subtropicus]